MKRFKQDLELLKNDGNLKLIFVIIVLNIFNILFQTYQITEKIINR